MSIDPAYEPWDGYEDEDDEEALIRRLELKIEESRDRYRERVHQRASDLYDDVGGWQRS
jgi:hypothetical protein